MARLLLIDGNSIANRAFYALPLLTSSKGVYTNAALGFTTMLLRILEEEKPDYIACIFDAGKVTFRHAFYQEYKGTRQKTPQELSGQFPMIQSILEGFGIAIYQMENYEADDIIGTFSKQASNQGIETIIVSGDKDTFQLVGEHTKVYLTKKGISETEIINVEVLKEKFDLSPQQMIDVKGLMGDTSDNIPGVPGVGEKTALKLIQEYETLENVIANIEQIKGKLKERLMEHQEQALLSKRLATIDCEAPLTIDWEIARYTSYDKEKILPIFMDLEFKQLVDRLGLSKDDGFNDIQMDDISFRNITEESHLAEIQILDLKEPMALYFETSGSNYHKDEVISLSIVQGEHRFLIMQELLYHNQLKDIIENARLLVYDAKRTFFIGNRLGVRFSQIEADVMLMNYLLDPTDSDKDISDIANQYGIQLIKEETIFNKKNKEITRDHIANYLMQKTEVIGKLSNLLLEKLQDSQMEKLFTDLELPLAMILSVMEKQGVAVDSEILATIGQELSEQIENVTTEIYTLAGEEFNINSPKQMGHILFDKLGLPPIKKTKTGYSTNADVLEKLADQHEIVDRILLHRQLVKLNSTYIEGLLKVVNPETQRIHTFYNQALTATGRLSSTEPNLQNIPIRLEEGRKIRKAFVPSEKGWKLLAADYSQIELRILAHISKDARMIEAFHQGIDIHTKTASDVFGVPLEAVDSHMRRQAKAVNFGIVYGISDYGLSQNLNISRKEAKEFIDLYLAHFSGVKEYMSSIIKLAKKQGFVQTILHRRRYLPDIHSPNFNIRSFAERTAMNTPIQGTAADIIKLAMVRIDEELQQRNLKTRMLLQVHDELIFEVPEDEIVIMTQLVPEVMENCISLSVPLKVDLAVGGNWFDTK
ncbi:DNA polymerase I [Desulfuribacillus stibiiarsenatis]|uniref:DNA polymerase I n=1 Tax=Desulfuribacillus stibiiarsenatis TaxID=1390249 RepID=A0A1E5L314_9FIRM|nr:DNA polymerase I [Desulfuribacillus stibiiarsenatis]OEH84453.1 DNA polymerase I [Desulfuribacillus stibiiarsenatis]